MMSKEKYQQALSNIGGIVLEPSNDGYHDPRTVCQFFVEDIVLLHDLVDIYPEYLELKAKATPKKIVYREFMKLTPGHEYKESCPNCNSVFDYDELGKKHCSECGQAIDWSE